MKFFQVVGIAVIFLALIELTSTVQAQTPVNPRASQEAISLLQYFYDIQGKRIVSGMHNEQAMPVDYDNQLKRKNGDVEPGIWGNDFRYGAHVRYRQRITDEAVNQWKKKGKIVHFLYHQVRPQDPETAGWMSVQGEFSEAEFEDLLTSGTPIYDSWKEKMDDIAYYLQQLEDQGVPVFFSPYHDMNGCWFWWGCRDKDDQYKRLWRQTYDYLSNVKGLNNLLWVLTYHNTNTDFSKFYPGDKYVDVVSINFYSVDFLESKIYKALKAVAHGKPIAIGQIEEMFDIQNLQKKQPDWVWFMGWRHLFLEKNETRDLIDEFKHPFCLNSGELPRLNKYTGRKQHRGEMPPRQRILIRANSDDPYQRSDEYTTSLAQEDNADIDEYGKQDDGYLEQPGDHRHALEEGHREHGKAGGEHGKAGGEHGKAGGGHGHGESEHFEIDLTGTMYGFMAVLIFAFSYLFVIGEDLIHMKKSIPVIISAGVVWGLVGAAYAEHGVLEKAAELVEHNILEFGALFLFLLASMTFVNTMEERQVFNALRAWLVRQGLSLFSIYWVTGFLAFAISSTANNLTTALLMAAVAMAVGKGKQDFLLLACVNIVVASNAGGAFSPFGDITTLMVWQKGVVQFEQFFVLFLPSLANWLVPAVIMSLFVPKGSPEAVEEEVRILPGGITVMVLFIASIILSVLTFNILSMPSVLGMMTGLGVLKLYGYYLQHHVYYRLYHIYRQQHAERVGAGGIGNHAMERYDSVQRPKDLGNVPHFYGAEAANTVTGIHSELTDLGEKESEELNVIRKYDVYNIVARSEWDTLMFFYGVVLGVGGLSALGYLNKLSEALYGGLGNTWANIIMGALSAIVDNIPIMFAVLTMQPEMDLSQWLLITLTAGVGGSLLAVGSASGIALMGQAKGIYTFVGHMKWIWAIALGYGASILVHLAIN